MPVKHIQELMKLMGADQSSEKGSNNAVQDGVQNWLGRASLKIASGTWDVAKDVTAETLARAIQKFVGL